MRIPKRAAGGHHIAGNRGAFSPATPALRIPSFREPHHQPSQPEPIRPPLAAPRQPDAAPKPQTQKGQIASQWPDYS